MKTELLQRLMQFMLGGLLQIVIIFGCHHNNQNETDSELIWEKTGKTIDKYLYESSITINDPDDIWITTVSLPPFMIPAPTFPISLFYSHDGGKSWGYIDFPGTENFYFGTFSSINRDTAWIMINNRGLLRTTDGGKNWITISDNFKNRGNCLGLHFFNKSEAIATFYYFNSGKIIRPIFRTSDGGKYWTELPSVIGQNEISSPAIGKNLFEACVDTIGFLTTNSKVYLSKDMGKHWKEIFSHIFPDEALHSIAMTSSYNIVVSSIGKLSNSRNGMPIKYYGHTHIFSTRDGGASWQSNLVVRPYHLSLSSIPGNDSTFIGTHYMMYNNSMGGTFISTDRGKTFTEIDSLMTNISGTAFYSIYKGYGVSFNANDAARGGTNSFYRWNPAPLFRKGILRR